MKHNTMQVLDGKYGVFSTKVAPLPYPWLSPGSGAYGVQGDGLQEQLWAQVAVSSVVAYIYPQHSPPFTDSHTSDDNGQQLQHNNR